MIDLTRFLEYGDYVFDFNYIDTWIFNRLNQKIFSISLLNLSYNTIKHYFFNLYV